MKAQPNWNLLTKYINNECGIAEKDEFETWLNLSGENKKYFNKIKEAWGSYGASSASLEPDKAKAWQNISKNFVDEDRKPHKLYSWSIRVAAAIVFVFGLAYLLNNQFGKNISEEHLLVQTNTDSLAKKIILPDNTAVWLNKNTTVKFPETFSGDMRHVYLEGEAFFEVTKNPNRPFVIETEKTMTKVLGTSFTLRAYKEENAVEINVNSGKVEFYAKMDSSNKVVLTKGLAGMFDKQNNLATNLPVFDVNHQSWKTGRLFFNKYSLKEVCKTLERHYDKKIIIKNEALGQMTISATYNKQSFMEVIDLIAQTLDIKYNVENGVVVIYNN